MSTTARKARKRLRHDDLSLRDALVRRGLPADSVFVHPPFQHPAKVGTPIAARTTTLQRRDARLQRQIDIANRRGWLSRLLFRTR